MFYLSLLLFIGDNNPVVPTNTGKDEQGKSAIFTTKNLVYI